MSEFENQLGELRKEIDDLDNQLVDLIAKRSAIVEKVAELKINHSTGKLFIRPGREATMIKRMASLYAGKFPKEAVVQIWRILISGSCNVEQQLKVCSLMYGQNKDYYWLAREYFTAFCQFSTQPTSARVIGELLDGKSTVGILPVAEETQLNDAWWLNLASQQTRHLKVFTRLPAIVSKSTVKEPSAFAIGNVEPEETGDDKTLITVTASKNLSTASLSSGFDKAGIKVKLVATAQGRGAVEDSSSLFEADGFIKESDPKLEQFKVALGKALVLAVPIGSYSTQINS